MQIAICDDEVREINKLYSLIEDYALKKDYHIRCSRFSTGRELLKQDRFDLYFLDYMMDEMNGVELAQALKEKFQSGVTICYLTNYESAALEVINRRIYADGFLKKPVAPAMLYEKLEQFYRASFADRLELKKGKAFRTVYTKEILYIEADRKRSLLHFADHTEAYNYLLSDLENNVLPGEVFFRIHRSFVVNMQHVVSYDGKGVTLTDGTVLPLKARNFRDVYRNYLFRSGN
ncbi:MAG: response regulator transcription factor [Clostridia bacterium]|nr:response regulator transcription factor [Clostridia bacterium]